MYIVLNSLSNHEAITPCIHFFRPRQVAILIGLTKVMGFLNVGGVVDPGRFGVQGLTLVFVMGGAALFGVGWGLAGYCLGPASRPF